MWWVSAALAQQVLELHPSPDAQVMLLGSTRDRYAEIGVFHNRAPIGVDVQKWRPVDGLVDARFIDAGGGTQFVVLEVEDDRMVELVLHPDRVELKIVRGRARDAGPPGEVPTIDALFAGVAPTLPDPPRIELHPLLGNARTYGPTVPVVRLEVDEPQFELPAGWDSLAAVATSTWDDIRRWSKALPGLEDPELKMVALYRLGDAYREIGLAREARYYFEQGSELGFPPAAMFLRRAEAAMTIGNHEDARYSCYQAHRRDARDGQVLACLGLLALAGGDPAPAATGRALAHVAQTATERLVAGELLLRGGQYAEAVAPLSAAMPDLHGSRLELAAIALGDAWLLQGEVDRAHEAYLRAPHVQLDGVIRARELMVRMIRGGVRNWPQWMPDVDALAREGGPQGAEALFLAAQVQERYQDDESAAALYAATWDLYPAVRDSDIPVRLLAACGRRVAGLARDARDAEVVAVFDACWRHELTEHVANTHMFTAAARAYGRLGLAEQAFDVQLELTTVLASVGREDPVEIATLAEFALGANRPEQALDTLRYGQRRATTVAQRAHLDLVEGRALLALGRRDETLVALQRAAADPTVLPAAKRYLAIAELRAGRCAEGLDGVGSTLAAAPLPEASPGEVEILAVRCAAQLGRAADVLAYAGLAIERARDEWTPQEARWIATLVAARAGVALPEGLRSDAPALESLRVEDATHAVFLAQIAEWERGGPR